MLPNITENKKITEMTVEEIMAERALYEDVVRNCTYKEPQEIADLFQAYTMLIWKHKQVGRVYDFYFDGLKEERDGGDNLEGSDHVVWDTLRALARFPDLNVEFVDIHCVRDGDNYRFGQVVYNTGSSAGGVGPNGPGNGQSFEPYEDLEMCECWIQFIDGKWRVGKEASIRSNDAYRRLLE